MKKIYIVYDDQERNEGSVQIRGFQVYQKLKDSACSFDICIIPISEAIERNLKNSVILCVKPKIYNAYKCLDDSNFIIFDILDTIGILENADLKQFSTAIFCSDKIRSQYAHKFKYPELCQTIYHSWDSRLTLCDAKQEKFSIGYFGERVKAKFYFGMEKDMSMYYVNYLNLLNKHNCHYVIKPDNLMRNFEPLTKIAIAAMVSAPVIALPDHATELLGNNYPYYVNTSIKETIDQAKESFGGYEWNLACKIMRDVKKRTSLNVIIKDYENLFEEVR